MAEDGVAQRPQARLGQVRQSGIGQKDDGTVVRTASAGALDESLIIEGMSASESPQTGGACRRENRCRRKSPSCRPALNDLRDDRQRAECMASIQSDAVQLALDLLVTHPDLRGFFRMFIKRLVDDSEAHACGVWLLDEATGSCDLWMANIGGETLHGRTAPAGRRSICRARA